MMEKASTRPSGATLGICGLDVLGLLSHLLRREGLIPTGTYPNHLPNGGGGQEPFGRLSPAWLSPDLNPSAGPEELLNIVSLR